jgi:hypothetical protein
MFTFRLPRGTGVKAERGYRLVDQDGRVAVEEGDVSRL